METNKQIQLVATGCCTSIDEYLQSQAFELDKPGFIIDRDGSIYGIRAETPKVALVNVGPVILRDGLWLPAEEGADGKYHPIEGADPVRVPYEYCSCRKYHGCQHYEMFPDKQLKALRHLLCDIKQELGMSYPWDNQLGAVCPRAVNGGSGIYFASSYDEQRSDPHPQKELLDIIKRLADDNH